MKKILLKIILCFVIISYGAFVTFGVGYAVGSLSISKQDISVWLSSVSLLITGVTSLITLGAIFIAKDVSKEWMNQKVHESRGFILRNLIEYDSEYTQIMFNFTMSIAVNNITKKDEIRFFASSAKNKLISIEHLKKKVLAEALYLSSYSEYRHLYANICNLEGLYLNTAAFTNEMNLTDDKLDESLDEQVIKMKHIYYAFQPEIKKEVQRIIRDLGFDSTHNINRVIGFNFNDTPPSNTG